MTEFRPGQIRYTEVKIPLINPDAAPKQRPVILLYEHPNGWWAVMGITSLQTYGDGTPRVRMLHGLNGGIHQWSYLWGQPTNVPPDQIHSLGGMVSEEDAETILELVPELNLEQVCRFWDAIEETP